MNTTVLVLIAGYPLFLVAVFRLQRKINKWRDLTQEGFDCCIEAVRLQVDGKDWKPPMKRAREIRRQLDCM